MRALLRRDGWLVAFLAWTGFVWISRIRNVLGNEDLDGAGTAVRLAVVAAFLGLATMVVVRWRRPDRRRWLAALVAWTVVLWTAQMVGILLDDHDLAFVLVHAALAGASIGLGVTAWRSQGRDAVEPRVGATL